MVFRDIAAVMCVHTSRDGQSCKIKLGLVIVMLFHMTLSRDLV